MQHHRQRPYDTLKHHILAIIINLLKGSSKHMVFSFDIKELSVLATLQ